MRLGILFAAFGAALGWGAIHFGLFGSGEPVWGGLGWVLAWPALSFLCVAAGYLALGGRVLGKRADGTRALWSRVLHAPYDLLVWLTLGLLRLSSERPFDEVSPGLWVGRRCPPDRLPKGVAMVVDMTAELAAPAGLPEAVRYRCLPTLDGHAPRYEELRDLVAEMAVFDGPIYVHCAAGHGRSATAAAALLLVRGAVADLPGAVALMRRSRPGVRLVRRQRRLAARFASTAV